MLQPAVSRARVFASAAGLCMAMAGLVVSPPAVHAGGDALYGALIFATKEDHPKESPPEIRELADSLRELFGYNQFQVVGQQRKEVPKGTEDWLVSTPKFFLRVDTKSPLPGGYALGLQLMQEKRVLVDVNAQLLRSRPICIKGPLVGDGQLIILLMVL